MAALPASVVNLALIGRVQDVDSLALRLSEMRNLAKLELMLGLPAASYPPLRAFLATFGPARIMVYLE